MKRITDAEKLTIRNKAKEEYLRLEEIRNNSVLSEQISKFKERYSECEIVYKVLLAEHQYYKNGVRPERMTVSMTQVPHALIFAGYAFDRELLSRLFGGQRKVGSRSVKILRDELTHGMNQSAVDELSNRHAELYSYMDRFLSIIRDFDSAA